MKDIAINSAGVTLVAPDADRDAPSALSWFNSPHGKETLLLMGNAEHEIGDSTLEREKKTILEFLELEKAGEQLTWAIRQADKTLGAVWIVLKDSDTLKAPSVHIMIGDKASRGKGIGRAVLLAVIQFINHDLHIPVIYSRHLVSNAAIARLLYSLDFVETGSVYKDENDLSWQNVILMAP